MSSLLSEPPPPADHIFPTEQEGLIALSQPAGRRATAELARGFAGVTAASVLGNVFSYVLLLTAARRLDVSDYSALVSLLNVLLIGSVPQFALQAVVARRVATGNTHDLLRVGAGLAAAVGVLFALIAPAEEAFLHLNGPIPSLLVALAIPGTALQGFCQGAWQGRQRFGALAAATFAGLAGRTGLGLAGLLIGGTATSALTALAVGVTAVAAVCLLLLPRLGPTTGESGVRPARHELVAETRSLLTECAVAAHAYAVLLLLSVADVLLANHVLDRHAAAVYAAGSIMTKTALWLPQSAANVLFASMTDHGRHRELFLRAVAGLVGLGAVLTVGGWFAGGLASTLISGDRYPELHSHVWLFAALGSCLAVTQFAVVSGLALRDGRAAWVAWLTIVAEVIGVYALGEDPGVGAIVLTVAGVNVIAAAATVAFRASRGDASSPDQLGSSPGQGPGANTGA